LEASEYLKPTNLAQSDHPEIAELAVKLTSGLEVADAVKSLYMFVRDAVKWTIEGVKPAIEVLRSRKGICFNKASLQVALLRAAGIPARYRLEEVDSRVLKPYLPPRVYELFPSSVIHVLAEVHLGGVWLGCDATLDFALSMPSWKRSWDVGVDLSCIPPIYKIKVVGQYPDLPVDVVLNPIRDVVEKDWVQREVDEYLDKIRAMSPEEKLKHFTEGWGSSVVENLRSRR